MDAAGWQVLGTTVDIALKCCNMSMDGTPILMELWPLVTTDEDKGEVVLSWNSCLDTRTSVGFTIPRRDRGFVDTASVWLEDKDVEGNGDDVDKFPF